MNRIDMEVGARREAASLPIDLVIILVGITSGSCGGN